MNIIYKNMKNISYPRLNHNPSRWDNFFLRCIGEPVPKPIVKGNMFMAKSEFERLKAEQQKNEQEN